MQDILEIYHSLPRLAQVVILIALVLLAFALVKRIVKLALFVTVVIVLIFVAVVLSSGLQ